MPIRSHGESYARKIIVNQGNTVYHRNCRWCAECGEVDSFLHPNFAVEHGKHDPNKHEGSRVIDHTKTMERAA